MRHFRLGVLIWAVLVWTSTVVGQGTAAAPSTSDPQAVALVQKALVALTGGAPVTDVTLAGTARRIAGSDDETGTATLTATFAGDSKLSLNFPSGPRTEIRNHSALPLADSFPKGVPLPAAVTSQAQPVGAWSGPDGTLHGMASHNVFTDAVWFFPAVSLGRLAASSNSVVSYVGQETLNGQSVLHVSAYQQLPAPSNPPPAMSAQLANLPRHLSQIDLYLDSTTVLPVALAFNTHPDGNALIDIPVKVQFSDYQSTSGALVPLHVQKFLNRSLVLDLQFDNATLNSGLGAASFQLQ